MQGGVFFFFFWRLRFLSFLVWAETGFYMCSLISFLFSGPAHAHKKYHTSKYCFYRCVCFSSVCDEHGCHADVPYQSAVNHSLGGRQED